MTQEQKVEYLQEEIRLTTVTILAEIQRHKERRDNPKWDESFWSGYNAALAFSREAANIAH